MHAVFKINNLLKFSKFVPQYTDLKFLNENLVIIFIYHAKKTMIFKFPKHALLPCKSPKV